MLTVRAHCDERFGRWSTVGPVEREVEIACGTVDFASVHAFCSRRGVHDEPTPPWCLRSASRSSNRDNPHALLLDPTHDAQTEVGVDDGRRLQERRMSPRTTEFEQDPQRSRRGCAVDRITALRGLHATRRTTGHPVGTDPLSRTTTPSRSSLRISTRLSAASSPGSSPAVTVAPDTAASSASVQ